MSERPFVLYADENWLVVDKPYGLPTHGGDAGDVGVQEWLSLHCGERTFVCSRLDKGTTGVLLLARHASASALAEKIHTEESARKTYCFLSHVDCRDTRGQQWRCEHPLDGKSAATDISFDRQIAKNVFRYQAVITRGRMHQIRRHAAHSGCPLLGDVEYGGLPAARIALHCIELIWPGLLSPLCAPLPEFFTEKAHSQGHEYLHAVVALDRRGRWLSSITSAWRVVQRGELPDGDWSVDIYGQHILVWVYDDSELVDVATRLGSFLDELKQMHAIKGIVFRRIGKNPHKEGLVREIHIVGQPPEEQFVVHEHDWKAHVTLTQRQHVGLFLDHRDNRRRVQTLAGQKRVANLFSYTCAFGLTAALAGCDVVMNVDASASTLALGKQNFSLNDLSGGKLGKFIEKDVRVWLEKQTQKHAEGTDPGWDIIICDPPTFSSTQERGAFHVSKQWSELAESCARILKKDGVCFFSTNCQAHEKSAFEKTLQRFFKYVQRLRAPIDFPEINGRTHAYFFECRQPLVQDL